MYSGNDMPTPNPAYSRNTIQTLRLALAVGFEKWVKLPLCTLWARLQLHTWGARAGAGLKVFGRLRLHVSGELVLGDRVSIHSGPSNYVGGDRRTSIRVGRDARVVIGNDCGISNCTISAMTRIVLHEHTMIGGGCDIYDNDFHAIDLEGRMTGAMPASAPVEIGPRAFVGSHCIILKGVTVGEGAVIGAGSVVARSVPPFELWGGRPARFIRKLAPFPPAAAVSAGPAARPAEARTVAP